MYISLVRKVATVIQCGFYEVTRWTCSKYFSQKSLPFDMPLVMRGITNWLEYYEWDSNWDGGTKRQSSSLMWIKDAESLRQINTLGMPGDHTGKDKNHLHC